jgi:hypothetical protein
MDGGNADHAGAVICPRLLYYYLTQRRKANKEYKFLAAWREKRSEAVTTLRAY